MTSLTRSIPDFTAAVHTAITLHDLYGRYATVAVLDPEGRILDMTPFAGDDACVLCATEWAACRCGSDERADHAVVLSGSGGSVLELREDDVRLFHFIRDELASCELEVLDWIQTDGQQVRSLAFSCDVVPAWDEPEPEAPTG